MILRERSRIMIQMRRGTGEGGEEGRRGGGEEGRREGGEEGVAHLLLIIPG